MSSANLFTPDADSVYQRGRLLNATWEGATVTSMTGTLGELYQAVPLFSRHPFRSGGEENRYKDEIRREPLRVEEDPIPVATVSKTYSLIQHRDVLSSVYRALQLLNLQNADVESTLLRSEYGERMLWSCQLPNFDFDPGDGHPMVMAGASVGTFLDALGIDEPVHMIGNSMGGIVATNVAINAPQRV